ncbi:MAG: HPr family phosphocarrier protein [Planctomycetota bacterium]|jgi:hypothetical protein
MSETSHYLQNVLHPESITRIDDDTFLSFINKRSKNILSLCYFLETLAMGRKPLTRPLLGSLISEAAMLEEVLDAYGARNNRNWYPFRHLIAATKLFADLAYKVLHIQHSVENYCLPEVEGNMKKETDEALIMVGNVIMIIAERLMREAKKLNMSNVETFYDSEKFNETLPAGCLSHDRSERHLESAEESITYLASEFLNLATTGKALYAYKALPPQDYPKLIPEPLSEEHLRHLEHNYHNLQSLYDTYLSGTDVESTDANLHILRGHISIIFHLLEIATGITHYYERHIQVTSGDTTFLDRALVNPITLLNTLVNFPVTFAGKYIETGSQLCRDIIKKYSEIQSIKLPVPKYRGFHVRPSTMIARIIHHYGSNVTMFLGETEYDAGAPLDLFRANEEINAVKRRKLANEITHMNFEFLPEIESDMISAVRKVVLELAQKQKLVIYEQPLPLEELTPEEGETLSQFAVDEITRMLAMGKIDIVSDIIVTFTGDKRPLADIKLLAENGYGEDNFGNNIPLPDNLLYLRR